MPCKAIIHAVAPVWSGNTEADVKYLSNAINKALTVTSDKKMTSIAFPAMLATPFHMNVLIKTVQEFILEKQQSATNLFLLKDIYFIDKQKSNIISLEKCLETLPEVLSPSTPRINPQSPNISPTGSTLILFFQILIEFISYLFCLFVSISTITLTCILLKNYLFFTIISRLLFSKSFPVHRFFFSKSQSIVIVFTFMYHRTVTFCFKFFPYLFIVSSPVGSGSRFFAHRNPNSVQTTEGVIVNIHKGTICSLTVSELPNGVLCSIIIILIRQSKVL